MKVLIGGLAIKVIWAVVTRLCVVMNRIEDWCGYSEGGLDEYKVGGTD